MDTSVGGGAVQRWRRGDAEVGEGKAQMTECKAQGYIVQHGKHSQYTVIIANRKNLKVV